jgi:putative hydrolase of the HAD superfamily
MTNKHLFFDLDRTLWDFEKNSEIALFKLFLELGLNEAIDSFELFHSNYKKTNAHLWKEYGAGRLSKENLRNDRFRLTLEQFDVNNPDLVTKISDGYVELSPQQTALFPHAHETLDYLQKEGYNMHIITNGFKEVQYIKLNKSGLDHYFDVIVCSEDVGQNKPSPAIFKHSLDSANAKATDSVMIGDDYEVDVVGAQNYGMYGILFDPENSFKHFQEQHRIQSLNELPGLLPFVFK